MITKQQITTLSKENVCACNDGHQLAKGAAEYCMGWQLATPTAYTSTWYRLNDEGETVEPMLDLEDWQPHQPTEKGKAQAVDLAEKYGLGVDFIDSCVYLPWPKGKVLFGRRDNKKTWQIAVLNAALFSEIGE